MKKSLIFFLLLIAGISWLVASMMPYHYGNSGFVVSVLRNWHEYGYSKLQGQLVYNAGGIDVEEDPQVYTGHRPLSILPIYLIYRATGDIRLAKKILYLVLTLALCIGMRFLFPTNSLSTYCSLALCFSPGYARIGIGYDPVTHPILIGFPFMVLFLKLNLQSNLSKKRIIFSFLILFIYACLNWTTAYSFLAVLFTSAVLLWRTNRKRIFRYIMLVGFLLLPVCIVSIFDKASDHIDAEGIYGFITFLGEYTFAEEGYAQYSTTWGLAFIRIVVVQIIGVLPLWLFLVGYIGVTKSWSYRKLTKIIVPLGGMLLSTLILRNLFAHHPWNATPLVIYGIVFSMYLTLRLYEKDGRQVHATKGPIFQKGLAFLAIAFCVLHGFFVISLFRNNSRETDLVSKLIQENTPRQACLVLGSENDHIPPERARIVFDRFTLSLDQAESRSDISFQRKDIFLLTSTKVAQYGKPVNKATLAPSLLDDWLHKILVWYRNHIAKRQKGDRLELGTSYYLYRFPMLLKPK